MSDLQPRARVVRQGKPLGPPSTVTRSQHDARYSGSTDVDFHGVVMERVDFSRVRFDGFGSSGSRFVDCDFAGCRFDHGLFSHRPQSLFVGCTFEKARFGAVSTGTARFERCRFTNVKIKKWFCSLTEFVDCVFSGRIESTNFYGRPEGPGSESLVPPRTVNEFRGNDFRDAELVDTSFRMGIDLRAQQLPEGDEYVFVDNLAARVEAARRAVVHWSDLDARRRALAALEGLAMDVEDGQEQLFARRDFAHPELVALLER